MSHCGLSQGGVGAWDLGTVEVVMFVYQCPATSVFFFWFTWFFRLRFVG